MMNMNDLSLFTPSSSLDPFNDMELKTINELEELRHILQNHQIDQEKVQKQQEKDEKNKKIDLNLLNNFGLPKVSFIDLDINSSKNNKKL